MIKQQLKEWKQFYQSQIEQTQNYIVELKKEKQEIENNNNNTVIPNIDSFLLSLSIEFNQYQIDKKIGTSLQKLIDYPNIHRHNNIKKEIKEQQIKNKFLESKLDEIEYNIKTYQEEKDYCKVDVTNLADRSWENYGMDPNLAKRDYTKSFERVGETEKYHWYESLKDRLSISFHIVAQCKNCRESFKINIWKHYPLITNDTDLKTAKIYEIDVVSNYDHGIPDEFIGCLIDRKQTLFKFFDTLIQYFEILKIDDCM